MAVKFRSSGVHRTSALQPPACASRLGALFGPGSVGRRKDTHGGNGSWSVRATAFQPVPSSTWATLPGNNPGAQAPNRSLQLEQGPALLQKVHASFDSLNRRDHASFADCLTDDVMYEGTSDSAVFSGRDGVSQWFRYLMTQVPDEALLHVDAVSINSGATEATVSWHVEVGGLSVPWSRGTSIYTLGQDNKISSIQDKLELPLGLALPALGFASPAVGMATPLLKSLQEAISLSGVASLLGPLSGDVTGGSAGWLSAFKDTAGLPALPSTSFPSLPSFPFPSDWTEQTDRNRPSASSSGTSSSTQRSSSSASSSSRRITNSSKALEGKSSAKEIRMRVLSLPQATTPAAAPEADSSRAGTMDGAPRGSTSSSNSNSNSTLFRLGGAEAADRGTSGRGGGTASTTSSALSTPSRPASAPGTPSVSETRSSQATAPSTAPGYKAGPKNPLPGTASPQAQTDLSGVWSKDLAASDEQAYEVMLDVLGLSGLQRVTARLIEGMEIRHVAGKSFDVSYLTVVPFFKVTESSRIGYQTTMMRRDLRPGSQRTVAEEVLGGVRVSMDWGAPNAGALQEVYLLEGDTLSVLCNVAVGSQKATAMLMYRRMQGGADDLLRESRQRNSSLDAVMARQQERYGRK